MTEPFYKDESVVIYHGDCREVIPTLGAFDLVITDPPYGMEYQSNFRINKHDKIIGDKSMPVDVVNVVIKKADSAAYIFCRWDNLALMPKPKSVLVWVKNNWSMGDLKHEHGRQWEACCFYPRINHKFKKRTPDVLNFARTKNNLHPTQKPVGLIAALIEANECETILDPFAGSGTTGRAAKDLNKKSVLIEREERYCEVAAKLMAQ
jgi:site-specific DNA-methyltransferase (adenine-specific)